MKSRILLACLSGTALLFASALPQPASAFTTKAQASIWCAMIKIHQCHVNTQFDGFQTCSQWGTVAYNGGSVKCCMKWYCGNIH
jgi:hypothetical protein